MIFPCLNDLCPKSLSWCIMSRKPVVCGNCVEAASEILMRKWQEKKKLLGESNIHLDWIKDKYLLSEQSRIKSLPPDTEAALQACYLSSLRETRTITLCILIPLAAAKGETTTLPKVPTSQGFSALTDRLPFLLHKANGSWLPVESPGDDLGSACCMMACGRCHPAHPVCRRRAVTGVQLRKPHAPVAYETWLQDFTLQLFLHLKVNPHALVAFWKDVQNLTRHLDILA